MAKIILKIKDQELIEVDRAFALQFRAIRAVIQLTYPCEIIDIGNVTRKILEKVIEYCEKHVGVPNSDDNKDWDKAFAKLDQASLLDLMLVYSFFFFFSLPSSTYLVLRLLISLWESMFETPVSQFINIK
ncbi:hypothetical protein Tsubulata_032558 [Turnera subulata]|uniref:SKP1 component POZ domain-containing protein n=1 Tax=Turnera subulata TaxID=218843 RepID=A0A9Q0IZ92_9ROSI|nr:hypothetical protein Tsubulata_032558 [Turnera subulata]